MVVGSNRKVYSVLDNEFCSRKKVCAIKDKIYVIGNDKNANEDEETTNVVEYDTRKRSWRMITSASMGPFEASRNTNYDISTDTGCPRKN